MRSELAERATKISMAATTLRGLAELIVAFFSGSVALVAAAVDSFSDTVTSMMILGGLKISRRPADRGHPYGHAQAETLVSLLLAAALFFGGIYVAFLAIARFYSGTPVTMALEVFLVALLAILISGLLAWYKIRVGRKVHSMAVVADGYNSLSDALSAGSVAAGMVFVSLGYAWVDSAVALGIAGLILYWSTGIGKNALNILMGASPGKEIMEKIVGTCSGVPGVVSCHNFRARRVGSRVYADVHITVNPKITVEKSHEIATAVERRLKARIQELTSVVVHVEPAGGEKVGKKR
ncbi:MAG: cation diffusion facilitator family transporter [Candidatus Hadarchaeota archaeon]